MKGEPRERWVNRGQIVLRKYLMIVMMVLIQRIILRYRSLNTPPQCLSKRGEAD